MDKRAMGKTIKFCGAKGVSASKAHRQLVKKKCIYNHVLTRDPVMAAYEVTADLAARTLRDERIENWRQRPKTHPKLKRNFKDGQLTLLDMQPTDLACVSLDGESWECWSDSCGLPSIPYVDHRVLAVAKKRLVRRGDPQKPFVGRSR